MPTVQHAALTGAELHEPKGAATASAEQFYQSDGAASGSWDWGTFVLNAHIDDVSSASSHWVVSPYAADITTIYSVIDGTIATADAGLSFEIGGVAVTSGNITIANSGSQAGDVDSSTPTANNSVTAGQAIEIITDGASTNTVKAEITLLMKRTA